MSGGLDLAAWSRFFVFHSLELLLAAAVLVGGLLAWIRLVAKPQPKLSSDLVGAFGTTLTEVSSGGGQVEIDGRKIRAIAETRIGIGSRVRVVEVDGFVAKVALDAL